MARKTSKIGKEIQEGMSTSRSGRKPNTSRNNGVSPGSERPVVKTASGNLGDCRNITYQDMERRFIAAYVGVEGYREIDLVNIHKKWRAITKSVMAKGTILT